MEKVSLLVATKIIFKSYCPRILTVWKLDLGKKGSTMLLLEKVEDLCEIAKRDYYSLNRTVSVIERL